MSPVWMSAPGSFHTTCCSHSRAGTPVKSPGQPRHPQGVRWRPRSLEPTPCRHGHLHWKHPFLGTFKGSLEPSASTPPPSTWAAEGTAPSEVWVPLPTPLRRRVNEGSLGLPGLIAFHTGPSTDSDRHSRARGAADPQRTSHFPLQERPSVGQGLALEFVFAGQVWVTWEGNGAGDEQPGTTT